MTLAELLRVLAEIWADAARAYSKRATDGIGHEKSEWDGLAVMATRRAARYARMADKAACAGQWRGFTENPDAADR